MNSLFEFLVFSDITVLYVTIGIILLAISSAVIGSFFLFQKKSLIGDAAAHSMLPGICLGFLLAGGRYFFFLILGAFITGFISILLIELISNNSKIKIETSTAIILSVFFGIGSLLLSITQKSGISGQAGLQNFLFGKAASLLKIDVISIILLSILIIFLVIILFKEFKLITFDKTFAKSIGFPVKILIFSLNFLTILSITIGVQCVGVVLISAMLITPVSAARFWTNNLSKMIFLSASLGALSGYLGAMISYLTPSMPTGPWVVVISSIFAFISFLFSPNKGVIKKLWKQHNFKKRIEKENILKFFYQRGLKNNMYLYLGIDELHQNFPFLSIYKLRSRLNNLVKSNLLNYVDSNRWVLTKSGKHTGSYILKLHCLWEAYLTKYLKIEPSHVHEDAESIEHILTPELEKELISLIGDFPQSQLYDQNPKASNI